MLLRRMSNSSTRTSPPSIRINIEKPIEHTGGREKNVAEKKRKTSRSGKQDEKTTSASRIERQAETNESGAISVSEKAEDEEMSLDIGFPQFW
jgi:hypothetical protein